MKDMPRVLKCLEEMQHSFPLDTAIQFFRIAIDEDRNKLEDLLSKNKNCVVFDKIKGQLCELMKIRHPGMRLGAQELEQMAVEHLDGVPEAMYGVWVYYPWKNQLVHLLDEAEFIELRTSRNLYKITCEERDILAKKKIGIIGLSVGKSIATAIAMERGCGEMRLADFDTLELSNLNRLSAGTGDLGLPKTIIAAREIAEIDPFIKTVLYQEGISGENIDDFLLKDGKLDVLIDECDSLDIKIICRHKAREHRIPVLMDTNDRGMMDIERFDLEPNRQILHGLIDDLDPVKLKGLSNAEKLPYVLKIVDSSKISDRLRYSMDEFGKSIVAWPQLASAVFLGGAMGADVSRRILLNKLNVSGRFYIDLDYLIS